MSESSAGDTGSAAPAVGVLVALDGRLETAAAAALDADPGCLVLRRCADLAELLSAVQAGLGTVAVVSSTFDRLDADAVDRMRMAGCRVVGVVDPDRDSTDRVRALGVDETVSMSAVDAVAGSAAVVAAVLAPPSTRGVPSGGTAGRGDWFVPLDVSADLVPGEFPDVAPRVLPDQVPAVLPDAVPVADPGGPDQPAPGRRARRAARPVSIKPAPTAVTGVGAAAGPQGPAAELADHGGRDGRIVTVWGAPGSPGRTVTAVTMASELAATGAEVILVDADTHAASVASYLGVLDEAAGIVAAVRAGLDGRLGVSVLRSLAPEVLPGLRVLTGITRSARWSELRPAGFEALLDVARRSADVVVVDVAAPIDRDEDTIDVVGPRRNALALIAIERASGLVVVGAGDPIGLQRLVRALQELDALGTGPSPAVVANRVRSSAVGEGPARRIGEALARFAGVTEVTFVPEDRLAVDRAVLQGRCLLEAAPGSSIREPLGRLAATLAGRAAPAALTRRRRISGRRGPVASPP